MLSKTDTEIRATSENVLLVATFWINYTTVRSAKTERTQEELTHGIYQVMLLIAPFLRDVERMHLNTLAQTYKREDG